MFSSLALRCLHAAGGSKDPSAGCFSVSKGLHPRLTSYGCSLPLLSRQPHKVALPRSERLPAFVSSLDLFFLGGGSLFCFCSPQLLTVTNVTPVLSNQPLIVLPSCADSRCLCALSPAAQLCFTSHCFDFLSEGKPHTHTHTHTLLKSVAESLSTQCRASTPLIHQPFAFSINSQHHAWRL